MTSYQLRSGLPVVSMAWIPEGDDNSELLVVSECGLGKRTPVSDYPTKGRGGMGVITLDVTDKMGNDGRRSERASAVGRVGVPNK